MTNSITIDTGKIRVLINGGPDYIEFNPLDVGFAERVYAMMGDYAAKKAELERKSAEIDAMGDEEDENGMPLGMAASLAFMRDFCQFMNDGIDRVFGAGTADKLFHGAMTLNQYEQFLSGFQPFFEQARDEKLRKFTNDKMAGRVMK